MSTKTKILALAAALVAISLPFILLIQDLDETRYDLAEDAADAAGIAADEESAGDIHSEIESPPTVQTEGSSEKIHLEPALQQEVLTGRVVAGNSGEGIPGADLKIHLLPHKSGNNPLEIATDRSGGFELQLDIPESRKVDAFHVSVSAKGYQNFVTSIPRMQNRTAHDCGVLLLDENKEYMIHVMDESGRSVHGAKVEFYKLSLGLVMTKQSNSDGMVRITAQELKVELEPFTILVKAQAPGLAEYFIECADEEQIPEEVYLKPKEYLTTQVIDSKTGSGIPDAKLRLWLTHNQYGTEFFNRHFAIADINGFAKLPKLSATDNLSVNIEIIAEGYRCTTQLYYSPDKIPEKLLLDPVDKYISIQVINQETRRSIPDLPVKIKSFNDAVTNREGFFELPVITGSPTHFHINRKGYYSINTTYSEDPKTQTYTPPKWKPKLIDIGGIYQLELVPMRGSKAKIMVTVYNELNRPVPGAKVCISQLKSKKTIKSDAYTNSEGVIKKDDLYILPETELSIAVTCKGYVPHHSSLIFFPTEDWYTIDVVLLEGIRFDKIRVIDRNGDNVSDFPVQANLTMEDGSQVKLDGHTDKNGLCALDFPFFKKGEIVACYKIDRSPVEDKKKIAFEDILRGDEIVLVAEQVEAKSSFIKGTVCDHEGNPIEGAHVSSRLIGDKRSVGGSYSSRYDKTRTDKNGFFKLDVYKNRFYDLKIHYTKDKKFWSPNQRLKAISDGSDLMVTLVRKAVVEVGFGAYADRIKFPFGVRLVSESGEPVQVISTAGYKVNRIFKGVPPGRMRATYEADKEMQLSTPFFDVEEGKHVKITLE